MYIAQSLCRLLKIGYQFLGKGRSSAAIGPAKKDINGLWGVLHNKIRTFIIQLAIGINRQDIGMLQASDPTCFDKKIISCLLIKLPKTQDFEVQNAAHP